MPAAEKRQIVPVADAQALARVAAGRVMAGIAANPARIAICLAGGSTPKKLYQLLATPAYSARIPWDRVHWFVGDERFVPVGDPRHNMTMAREILLDRCAPPLNIHPIATDTDGPDASAERYERELKSFYGADRLDRARPLFDVVLLGIGPDGHTASIFPGGNAARETERWAVAAREADVAPFVPRVTLTLPVLGSTREMLFQVSGSAKRAILTRVLDGDNLPVSRAHAIGKTVILADETALPETFVANDTTDAPCAIIVMGVSGSGKSTIADALARRLSWDFKDGDVFHPESNVAKMRAGHPLTDEDRRPWLRAIADEIDRSCSEGDRTVIACSALKRAYREVLVHGRKDARIAFLDGSHDLIASRLAARKGHFMPPGLLASQFAALERPQPDENVITVPIDTSVDAAVDDIVNRLHLQPAARGALRRKNS